MEKNTTPEKTPSAATPTNQAGEERLPLLPGEAILNSYAARNGRFYATDRRLLFYARQMGQDSYRDLSYGEISSITLEPGQRTGSSLFMTAVFFVGAFVVFVLVQMIRDNQPIHVLGNFALPPDAGRLIGLLLSLAAGLWGIYRLLDFLSNVQRYTLAGPGLLRDARQMTSWEIPIVDKNAAAPAAFVQTVREQALLREVNRQVLADLEARLTAAIAASAPDQHTSESDRGASHPVRLAFPVFSRRPAWMSEPGGEVPAQPVDDVQGLDVSQDADVEPPATPVPTDMGQGEANGSVVADKTAPGASHAMPLESQPEAVPQDNVEHREERQ